MDEESQAGLETGWLTTTPVGDTYLRRFLFNWAGMCAARATAAGGRSEHHPDVILADSGRPAPFANCATLLRPLATETTAATLSAIDAFYGFDDAAHRGEVLLASAWPTGDLRPHGWKLMGHPPLHFLPAGATPRTPPPELRVEEVRDLGTLHVLERVAIAGYPFEALADAPPGSLVAPSWLDDPRSRNWVGWVDERPVACATAWVEHGINDVTLVATVPDARRRGYGEALTWRAARADPALPSMLLSEDIARPVYERMGYLPLLRLTLWYRGRPA
jgi:hypothetical protein